MKNKNNYKKKSKKSQKKDSQTLKKKNFNENLLWLGEMYKLKPNFLTIKVM